MNTKKGKGKSKSNKPPNPNPPQNVQEVINVEKIENEPEERIESVQKIEDRVPEIISEVVTPPQVESRDKEEDNPKKPKRNRGKKKKQDKDDNENQEGPTNETVGDVPLEIIEIETQEIIVEENVTPSARKKKNKKKITDTDIKTTEKIEKEVSSEEKKNIETDKIVKDESKLQDEQDSKTSKKKNKKKKQRNDSERSDAKVDEISCTSAFQMLLKDDKSDIKVSDTTPIDKNTTSSEKIIPSESAEELEKRGELKNILQEETKLSSGETTGKGKKKHKKDKKEQKKESESDVVSEISLMTAIKLIPKDEHIKDDQKFKDNTLLDTVISPDAPKVEEDIKPKAKIAKPVDRKNKEKAGQHFEEDSLKKTSQEQSSEMKEISIPEPVPLDIVLTEEITLFEKEKPIIPEPITDHNKHNVPKSNEKRQKGKSKKQSEETMTKTIEQHEIEKAPLILPQESVSENFDVTTCTKTKSEFRKDEKFNLPSATEEEAKKRINQETAKSTDRIRKGKKDGKSQEPLESGTENKKDKLVVSTAPLAENIFETKEKKAESVIDSRTKDKINPQKQDFLTKCSPDQESQLEKEIEPQTKTEIPVETVILEQADIFKNVIPIIPEPIENIQTKQEILCDLETAPLKPETEKLKETSFINFPESGMGKKRGKSPKPPKKENKIKISDLESQIIATSPEASTKTMAMEAPLIPPPPPMPIIDEPKEHKEKKPVSMMELLTAEILQESEDKDKTPFETKSKKKRKKSPKLPQEKVSVTESINPGKKMEQEKTGDIQSEKPQGIQESEDKGVLFSDQPSDIEISSLKADESEGSTCGFTPDIIQYPRATSQDPIDDNNNMLIQEIAVIEEVKLQIPTEIIDTPLIQGSGETPLDTPENILVGIRITQVGDTTTKIGPEKTDLKSKMMEVNQDMEELRLSIERSLAELTAIEKSEGETDKQIEGETTVTEELIPSETKLSMPSDMIAKSQSEKAESKEYIKTEIPPVTLFENKPAETNIPLKTSMFFDKELQDRDVDLKPEKVQHQRPPITDSPKPTDNIGGPIVPPIPPRRENKSLSRERENKDAMKKPLDDIKPAETAVITETSKTMVTVDTTATPPVCPARKDNKGKGKNKKKGKQEATQTAAQSEGTSAATEPKDSSEESKKEEKKEQKHESKQQKGKQQSDMATDSNKDTESKECTNDASQEFEPIENFEDAMTSSADDINKTFEMIADEASLSIQASHVNPEINIVAPIEDTKREKRDKKVNPVSQPKNLLGHPDIPVRLNKTDYKKEKNKPPNATLAKVKIKDAVEIEANKQTKDTQTDNIRKFMKNKSIDESFSSITNENDEFIYKYSFRKVFLQSACHVCKKEIKQTRVTCNFCNLMFYCNTKHKDEDWPQHQGFCFAISTIVHLKGES